MFAVIVDTFGCWSFLEKSVQKSRVVAEKSKKIAPSQTPPFKNINFATNIKMIFNNFNVSIFERRFLKRLKLLLFLLG